MQNLNKKFNKNNEDPIIYDMITLIYETSLLNSDYSLEKPMDFTNRIYKICE